MEIININLNNSDLDDYPNVVNECKSILNENLVSNGGFLRQANIFEQDFDWSNLLIARNENQIIGFALIRNSFNTHNLKDVTSYYYISEIAVKNDYKRKGVGTELMTTATSIIGDKPLVASVLKENEPSLALTSKFMKCFGESESKRYLRFVDVNSYKKLYGEKIGHSI